MLRIHPSTLRERVKAKRIPGALHACQSVHKEFVFTHAGKPIKKVKTAFQRA